MAAKSRTPDEVYLDYIEVYDLDEFLDLFGYDPTGDDEDDPLRKLAEDAEQDGLDEFGENGE